MSDDLNLIASSVSGVYRCYLVGSFMASDHYLSCVNIPSNKVPEKIQEQVVLRLFEHKYPYLPGRTAGCRGYRDSDNNGPQVLLALELPLHARGRVLITASPLTAER